MGANSGVLTHETESRTVAGYPQRAGNSETTEFPRVKFHLADSLWKRILSLIFPDQRKQERLPMPPLVGYLGTAQASKPYELGDISLTGFRLLTAERWLPGTEMPITLQRTNLPARGDSDSFTVQSTVVRWDTEGVGFSILLSEEESKAAHGNPLHVKWITRREMVLFLERLKALPASALPEGYSWNPVKSAASTQSGTRSRLNAAFVGGRWSRQPQSH
jgi:hypothetical protein